MFRLFASTFRVNSVGIRRTLVAIAIGVLCSTASAQVADWTTRAEAGLVAARGNTKTDTANAKLNVARNTERWKHTAGFNGIYSADETGTTGQRWDAQAQSDFNFDERGFTFASGRYEDDRFSGFDYQTTLAAGIGRRFIETDRTKLNVQLGVGYKILQTRDSISDDGLEFIPGEREEDAVGQTMLELDHALTDNTRLRNKLLAESGPDNTSVQNDITLQVNMNRALALALGYSVRYNTEPPDGFRTTDTLTTVNLVFELK